MLSNRSYKDVQVVNNNRDGLGASENTDHVDQTLTPAKAGFQCCGFCRVTGRILTRGKDVNQCAIIRERGHVVVDIHSTDGDCTGGATRRDKLGILSKVSGLNLRQSSMHRFFRIGNNLR